MRNKFIKVLFYYYDREQEKHVPGKFETLVSIDSILEIQPTDDGKFILLQEGQSRIVSGKELDFLFNS